MKLLTMIFGMISIGAMAQNYGEIKGRVMDEVLGEPVPFAHVWVDHAGDAIGVVADDDGRFAIKPFEPGRYDLHVKDVRFTESIKKGVEVRSNEITFIGVIGMTFNTLGVVEVKEYIEPLIRPDNPEKITISGPDLRQRADARNTRAMIVSLIPGVTASADGQQLYFRGSRPENMVTFIDGVKVTAGEVPNVPSNAIQNLSVYTGGIPAKYGDMTGGVVVIETKGYMDFYRESQRQLTNLP
ncbi:MAG: carboxypeptidase regulatory-like domain-containing protein [Bacteroidetes bacterium]|nr:carboxypeptidase regulatory-like domain-containing protein [Bacteroidota bacterium]MDA0972314.1 carboxypeptidase regulatory-like domain-containing protein [Bacteroidota bacterium]